MGGAVSSFVSTGLDMVSGGAYSASQGKGPYGSKALLSKLIPALTAPGAIPPAPELDPNAQAQRDEAARRERERRLASGRASTVLTGGLGDTSTPTTASAVLLGQ